MLELAREFSGETLAIVSLGGPVAAILCPGAGQKQVLDNCSIALRDNVLTGKAESFVINRLKDLPGGFRGNSAGSL